MSNLADTIKRLSVDAGQASDPDKIVIGHVTKCPVLEDLKRDLEIQISEKIVLRENDSFLRLTKYMKEKKKPVRDIEGNYHFYFVPGDSVILMRMNEGSKYILLDVI